MKRALLPVLAAASVLAGEPLVVETIRLEHESAARVFPDDAWSRAADPATNAPAVPLDLSVRFVELTDAALSNDFFRAAFAGTDSNSSEPVSDDVATFTQIFTAPQTDLLLLRLTNEFGCFATFRQTQRWNGGEEAQFSFLKSVFRYRNGQESPVEERTSGFFLSVAPRLESPSPGCWSISFELSLTDVGRPSPETPAGADGVYPERPFVPVRKLATSVDIFPGSVVFFRAGDGTTRSPLVVLECTPAAPLPAAPAVPPPAAPAVPEGFAHRLYSVPWMEQHSVFPYLVPTNAPAPSGEAVLALARELGADIPEGSTARYMPSIGKLAVTTSPAAFAEIEQLLSLLWGAAGGRVEVAASLLAVAAGDLDAFLARFGVPASPAALLAPVLARQPSLDDLLDLAENPPAADLAPSFDDPGNDWGSTGGIARRTVGNDECAELACVTHYLYPDDLAEYQWGTIDAPESAQGASEPVRAFSPTNYDCYVQRRVGPVFRATPRLAPGSDRISLDLDFEYRGTPVWRTVPSPGIPARRKDGSYLLRPSYVQSPSFPRHAQALSLDLADGEAALLRPFPDPNAPDGAPRFFVPVVSARRVPDPVQEMLRTPGSRLLAPSPETIARRRAIVLGESVAAPADPAPPPFRVDVPVEPNTNGIFLLESWFARIGRAELERLELGWLTDSDAPVAVRGLGPEAATFATILSAPQADLVLRALGRADKALLLKADPVAVTPGVRAHCHADGVPVSLGVRPVRSPQKPTLDLFLDIGTGAAPAGPDGAARPLQAYPDTTVCVGVSSDDSSSVVLFLLRFAAPVRPAVRDADEP